MVMSVFLLDADVNNMIWGKLRHVTLRPVLFPTTLKRLGSSLIPKQKVTESNLLAVYLVSPNFTFL